jgi:hypothetical protein
VIATITLATILVSSCSKDATSPSNEPTLSESPGISFSKGEPSTPPTPPTPPSRKIVDLGKASNFAILAGSDVACGAGGSSISGGLGVSPGFTLLGFDQCVHKGTEHLADATAARAQLDLVDAYAAMWALPCPPANNLTRATLGQFIVVPGVYCFEFGLYLGLGNAKLNLTLDGLGDRNATFVFRTPYAMYLAGNIILVNGADAKNVFFLSGLAATVEDGSTIRGTIISLSQISIGSNVTLIGRTLAIQNQVYLEGNDTIGLP